MGARENKFKFHEMDQNEILCKKIFPAFSQLL